MPFAYLLLMLGLLLGPAAAPVAEPIAAELYKDPWCGCCTQYGKYLEAHGFAVEVEETSNLAEVKRQAGVPEGLEGCHTLKVGGYVVEGHVPVAVLLRLLSERPAIAGISLPGMPEGSPGMSGEKTAPFTIHALGDNGRAIYAVE